MRVVEFSSYGPPSVLHVAETAAPHAGPSAIRVRARASGLATGEVTIRSGAVRDLVAVTFPWRTGFDAAGVVDEIGEDVDGVRVGDEVFGMTDPAGRAANADLVVLTAWARKPASWSWAEAGGAAGSVETATRVLDRLGIGDGRTLLVQGAAGAVGSVLVQLAAARGAQVIGTASARNHEFLRSLGAEPMTYGEGLTDRVAAMSARVDAVVDCAGGALPDLIAIAGDPARVVTIAPDPQAAGLGVHLSHSAPAGEALGGADPLAVHGLALAVDLADLGRLRIPVAATFPLEEAAAAHELSASRHARGRIVLVNRPAGT